MNLFSYILALSHLEIVFHNNWHLKCLSGYFYLKVHYNILFIEMHCIPKDEANNGFAIHLIFFSVQKKTCPK